MFQYAFGLAASKRIGAELKLDLSWFDLNSDHRSYILDRFNITTPVATQKEIEYVRSCNGRNFFEYRFNVLRNSLAPRHKKSVVKEDLSVFDEVLRRPHVNSYLEGYFSTEGFFDDHKSEIRKAYQFKKAPSSRVGELSDSINDSTVAFSIRRGDFLGNALHNLCSIGYFQRAIKKIKEQVSEPNILIFSDEMDWVEEHIKFDVPHKFVIGVADHMDHMRLMSMCKHHIIPNSTFSWWGAWLSDPKLVVAPDLWIADDPAIHNKYFGHWVETRHTVPESWIRIPASLAGEEMM